MPGKSRAKLTPSPQGHINIATLKVMKEYSCSVYAKVVNLDSCKLLDLCAQKYQLLCTKCRD